MKKKIWDPRKWHFWCYREEDEAARKSLDRQMIKVAFQ
jgi:hypothetical protein